MRKIYALGLQITTVGPNDGNGLFQAFVIANGGNMVTPDGRLHTDDPKVREAAIKSVVYLTDAYKQGYVPPEAFELERCGRQQRLPRKGVRRRLRRYDLDRAGDDQGHAGIYA